MFFVSSLIQENPDVMDELLQHSAAASKASSSSADAASASKTPSSSTDVSRLLATLETFKSS
jgi:glutamine synthetase adenylyltransferase